MTRVCLSTMISCSLLQLFEKEGRGKTEQRNFSCAVERRVEGEEAGGCLDKKED